MKREISLMYPAVATPVGHRREKKLRIHDKMVVDIPEVSNLIIDSFKLGGDDITYALHNGHYWTLLGYIALSDYDHATIDIIRELSKWNEISSRALNKNLVPLLGEIPLAFTTNNYLKGKKLDSIYKPSAILQTSSSSRELYEKATYEIFENDFLYDASSGYFFTKSLPPFKVKTTSQVINSNNYFWATHPAFSLNSFLGEILSIDQFLETERDLDSENRDKIHKIYEYLIENNSYYTQPQMHILNLMHFWIQEAINTRMPAQIREQIVSIFSTPAHLRSDEFWNKVFDFCIENKDYLIRKMEVVPTNSLYITRLSPTEENSFSSELATALNNLAHQPVKINIQIL